MSSKTATALALPMRPLFPALRVPLRQLAAIWWLRQHWMETLRAYGFTFPAERG